MSAFDPRDADPLHHVDAEQDLWDPEAGAWVPRQSALAAMLVALVTGIVAGVLLVFAISAIAGAVTAPRSAANAIPGVDYSASASPAPTSTGNPSQPSGAPLATPSPALSAARSATTRASGAPPRSPAADLKQSPAITPKPTKRPVTEPPAIEGGVASWCAPTPTQCRRWGGTALLGAVHSFRWGDRPYRVTIHGPAGSTVVTIVSYCQCYFGTARERLVDLSPAAFVDVCGRLSRGVCPVSMEIP